MAGQAALIATLPPPRRLALAYAPAPARPPWLALLALEARLGRIVQEAREPILGQIKLAWWRERLAEPLAANPHGEPLLAALAAAWGARRPALGALVDGWEGLLAEAPLAAEALRGFAEGRGLACAALAEVLGADAPAAPETSTRLGRGWALGDLAAHPRHPAERALVEELATTQDWAPARLPRGLRPLVVLHGLARRDMAGKPATGLGAFAVALRLGIWGF